MSAETSPQKSPRNAEPAAPPLVSDTANATRPDPAEPVPAPPTPTRPDTARPRHQPNTTRHPPPARSRQHPTRHTPAPPARQMRLAPAEPTPAPLLQPGPIPAPPNTTPARPRRGRKKRVPEIRNPPYDSRSSANYFDNSASAALALSAAGPAVTFWKAAMACGFISLAL